MRRTVYTKCKTIARCQYDNHNNDKLETQKPYCDKRQTSEHRILNNNCEA